MNKLYTKTLQVNVLSVVGQREEIVVSNSIHHYQTICFLIFQIINLAAFSHTGLRSNQFGRIQFRGFDNEMVQHFEFQINAQFRID